MLEIYSQLLSLLSREGAFIAATGHWIIALIFAWSGTVKLFHPDAVATALANFRITRVARRRDGLALGSLELMLGLAVLTPIQPLALATATTLLLFFTYLLGRHLLTGANFACNCFGATDRPIVARDFARTLSLALIALVLLLLLPIGVAPVSPLAAAVVGGGAIGVVRLLNLIRELRSAVTNKRDVAAA